jgi:endonuclease/exonuclease/phosphatase family metal-dependent hydrolase
MSRVPAKLTSHRDVKLVDSRGNGLNDFPSQPDDATGLNLSGLEASGPEAVGLEPVGMERDLLLAEFEVKPGIALAVFNVHLKSKVEYAWRRCSADERRAGEARMVAEHVSAYAHTHPHTSTLLVGDFNDTRHSEALAPIFALPLEDPLGDKLKRTGANPSTFWSRKRLRIDFVLAHESNPLKCLPDEVRIHTSAAAQRASDHYPVSIDFGWQ